MIRIRWAAALLVLLPLASIGCHEFDLDFSKGTGGKIVLYDDLYSVSVFDDEHAVAVGYYGAAYATEDGGSTWVQGGTYTLVSL